MKRLRLLALSLPVLAPLLACLLPSMPARADLHSDIDAVLADKLLHKGTVAVEVVRLGDKPGQDETVYSHNPQTPLIPASNLKLVTTAAALEKLGPAFKFKTELRLTPQGDVLLVGDGDPTLGDAEYLKKVGWKSTTLFEWWAVQLREKQNVRTVRDVLVDDSVFDEQMLHPHWPADQIQKRYVPEVAGLNLNANCVDFQIQLNGPGQVVQYTLDPNTRYINVRNSCIAGNQNAIWLSRDAGGNNVVLKGEAKNSTKEPVSVTVHDPALFAGTVFSETLAANGIRREGSVRRAASVGAGENAVDAGNLVAVHETPLATVLARANKDSMNLYAECLCKRLGRDASGRPGSWAGGTLAVADFLRSVGAADDEFHLDDGCGLSRENVISPRALAKVLSHEFHSKNKEAYFVSLSVAGVDGTLDDRFKGSDLRGRVVGKSGFVNGVRSLSGYLRAKDGAQYAFSILMNHIPDDPTIKILQEKIVKAVDAHASGLAKGE
jgi:D-alanyl-D-alanine carboxypeptidase/D-alanyl-D-alanine-endopeptidase (penicillin-binding protein 4)